MLHKKISLWKERYLQKLKKDHQQYLLLMMLFSYSMMHLQLFLPLQAHAYSEIGYQTRGPEKDSQKINQTTLRQAKHEQQIYNPRFSLKS